MTGREAEPELDGAPEGPIGPAGAERSGSERTFWIIATLALGAFGGWLFDLWRMPLAWMIGAMAVTTIASLSGLRLETPKGLRPVMITVLGVMLGSAFTKDTLANAGTWAWSLAAMICFIVVVAGTLAMTFHRMGWSPVTSYFAATPGGFGVMVLLAEDFGGDIRRISLVHAIRIMLTVLIIPFWFRFFEGYEPPAVTSMGSIASTGTWDLGVLLGCAVGGLFIGKLLRLPNAALLGPVLLSAIAHVSGLTSARPPGEVLAIAQVVIGVSVGCRFVGISLREVFDVMLIAVGSTLFMILMAAGFALALQPVVGASFGALWLAYAPGGLAEMALVSLAMGIDVAFVSTHHMVRVVFMVLTAAVLFRWLDRRFGLRG